MSFRLAILACILAAAGCSVEIFSLTENETRVYPDGTTVETVTKNGKVLSKKINGKEFDPRSLVAFKDMHEITLEDGQLESVAVEAQIDRSTVKVSKSADGKIRFRGKIFGPTKDSIKQYRSSVRSILADKSATFILPSPGLDIECLTLVIDPSATGILDRPLSKACLVELSVELPENPKTRIFISGIEVTND